MVNLNGQKEHGWVPSLETLLGQENPRLVEKHESREDKKAPLIKKRVIKKLEMPRIQITSADGKAALDLIFEQLEAEQIAEQQARDKQEAAEKQEKQEQIESIREYVGWMIETPLKFIQDVETGLTRLSPERQKLALAMEIPGCDGLTMENQLKKYKGEIQDARAGDDLTIKLYLTVAEEVFWLSAKNFSYDELADKIEGLVKNNLLREDQKGAIEGLRKKRYSLSRDFNSLDSDIKAELQVKLGTAIANQVTRFKEEIKEEVKEEAKKVVAKQDNHVSVEELLFGDRSQFQKGKSSVIAWKHHEHPNAISLERWYGDLYITGVAGATIAKDLAKMKIEMPKEMAKDGPYIPLNYILARGDDKHLCGIKTVKGKPLFDYSCYIEPFAFQMAFWIRLGAGKCLPATRLLEETITDSQESTESLGRILADKEFFFQRGLGVYGLLYPVGFYHNIEDENWKPTGEIVTLKEEAVLYITREKAGNKDFISLGSTKSKELASLLEKAGLELYDQRDGEFLFNGRFEDGLDWKNLPIVIGRGLKLAFGRLKASEK